MWSSLTCIDKRLSIRAWYFCVDGCRGVMVFKKKNKAFQYDSLKSIHSNIFLCIGVGYSTFFVTFLKNKVRKESGRKNIVNLLCYSAELRSRMMSLHISASLFEPLHPLVLVRCHGEWEWSVSSCNRRTSSSVSCSAVNVKLCFIQSEFSPLTSN